MKLTQAQISTIRFALAEAAEKHQERAARAPEGTFWKEEAESAAALAHLFKDALNVKVESVQLEPTKDACGDIHCRGQCEVKAPRLSSDHVAAEVERYARDQSLRLAKLIRPGSAMPAPAAIPAPAAVKDAASHPADSEPAPTAEPYADATSEATPPAVTDQRPIGHAPSSAGTLNPVPCAAALPPGAPAQAPSEGMHQPEGQAQPEPPAVPDSLHPIDSSAQHVDACGDINCDGQCPDLHHWQPSLIRLIDQSISEEAARGEIAKASPAALRAASYYLHVDLHDLPGALAKRVRTRLQQAA